MKGSVLGLALSTVAFGASSIYLWTELDQQRELAAAVRAANARLTAQVAELQQRRAAFGPEYPGGPDGSAGPAHVRPGELAADAPPPEGHQVWNTGISHAGNAPAMPEAMVKMMKSNMRAQNKRMYFDLQSKLGLTAAQTSDLLDLITEQNTSGFKGPRNMDPEAAREYWEAEQTKRKAAIEELLGSAKALEFEEYQKTMPSRSELMMISQQLEGVEMPLTDSQRSRLLDALVAERDRIPMPTYAEGMSPEDTMKAYDEWQVDYEKRVADAARGILTAEQQNTYSEYQQWEREMRQQFAKSSPGGGPPVRVQRDGAFMPAPGGGVAFSVTTENVSPSPTETPAESK